MYIIIIIYYLTSIHKYNTMRMQYCFCILCLETAKIVKQLKFKASSNNTERVFLIILHILVHYEYILYAPIIVLKYKHKVICTIIVEYGW